jgi:hypothetical protein
MFGPTSGGGMTVVPEVTSNDVAVKTSAKSAVFVGAAAVMWLIVLAILTAV